MFDAKKSRAAKFFYWLLGKVPTVHFFKTSNTFLYIDLFFFNQFFKFFLLITIIIYIICIIHKQNRVGYLAVFSWGILLHVTFSHSDFIFRIWRCTGMTSRPTTWHGDVTTTTTGTVHKSNAVYVGVVGWVNAQHFIFGALPAFIFNAVHQVEASISYVGRLSRLRTSAAARLWHGKAHHGLVKVCSEPSVDGRGQQPGVPPPRDCCPEMPLAKYHV